MQNNLIFLGGPHGSGKSTLEKLLAEKIENAIMPELKTQTPKFYSNVPEEEINFFHRQALKHAQRAIENYEYTEIARKNPGKIVIANRCIYDVLAYGEAYFRVGWISEQEKSDLDSCFFFLYGQELIEPSTIILNPGFEICKRHLEERWKTKPKKFMEDNMDYLRAVCEAYEKYRSFKSVFYIDREIDLKDEGRLEEKIQTIAEWIEKVGKPELVLV